MALVVDRCVLCKEMLRFLDHIWYQVRGGNHGYVRLCSDSREMRAMSYVTSYLSHVFKNINSRRLGGNRHLLYHITEYFVSLL